MRKFKSLTILAASVALLALPAITPSRAGLVNIDMRPGSNSGAFRVEKADSFKGVTQVVIGQFSVAFMTKKVDYDGGGFLSQSDKAKAVGNLTGVSNEDFQRITDASYADFLKQLAAHGVTVVDPAGMTANKYYAKVKSEAQGEKVSVALKKDDKADALAFWPSQLGGRNNNMFLNLRLFDMNMSNTYTAQYDYARTAKVPVLNVVYYVDFAKPATANGGRALGGLLQTITVKAGLAVSPFGTQATLMDTNGKLAKLSLNTAVEEGGDFANIVETTSAINKATRTAGAIGGMLGHFGGGLGGAGRLASNMNSQLSAKFEYQVTDTKAFGEKVLSASAKTSDLVLRQMEAMR